MDFSPEFNTLAILVLASLFAGFVDAVAGGGGLILTPALFAAYPAAPPPTLFGTNKSASIWGTTVSFLQYRRRVPTDWAGILPAVAASFGASLLGAWVLTLVSAAFLRQLLPVLLVALLLYTLAKKDLGLAHAPRYAARKQMWLLVATSLVMGFYDGFFGPGTGSILVFALVRLIGFDFLHASSHTKLINIGSNAAAVLVLGSLGHIWWHVALWLAAANILGGWLGARTALKHGAGFVRGMFLLVVTALILKTAKDAYGF